MSTYLIGDVHGCYNELIELLTQVKFTPKQDTLWLTGDLVSRGPDSIEVLRYVKSLGSSARIVLGNHDLLLIAAYSDVDGNKSKNHIVSLLDNDTDGLINWLRCQPLLRIDEEKKLVIAHAGITPQWDLKTAKICAHDVESVLSSNICPSFLSTVMCDNTTSNWSKDLKGLSRLRFIINAFTRMRYCFPDGRLDMHYKDIPENAPKLLKPWFSLSRQVSKDYSIVFGHWASLEGNGTTEGVYALDTGCCWGGKLTCLRWEDKKYFVQPSNRLFCFGEK